MQTKGGVGNGGELSIQGESAHILVIGSSVYCPLQFLWDGVFTNMPIINELWGHTFARLVIQREADVQVRCTSI